MSSIGIIFREDRELTTLPTEWTPVPLGSRRVVVDAVERALAGEAGQLSLRLTVESVDESPDPRTITAIGVWGPRESAVIRAICRDLAARFYDAEAAEFVELQTLFFGQVSRSALLLNTAKPDVRSHTRDSCRYPR